MVTPVWILWTIRAKLTDCGGRALSDATVAAERVELSFSFRSDVGPVKGLHGYAGVDLVDHQGEVDGLRWQGLVGRHGGSRARRTVVFARVVAQHAHFNLVAVLAVEG